MFNDSAALSQLIINYVVLYLMYYYFLDWNVLFINKNTIEKHNILILLFLF